MKKKKILILVFIVIIIAFISYVFFVNNEEHGFGANATPKEEHGLGALASDIKTINNIASVTSKPFQIKSCGPNTVDSGIIYPNFYLVGNFINNVKTDFDIFDSKGKKINSCEAKNANNDCLEKIKNISTCDNVFDTRYDK